VCGEDFNVRVGGQAVELSLDSDSRLRPPRRTPAAGAGSMRVPGTGHGLHYSGDPRPAMVPLGGTSQSGMDEIT
jgi:hypothetical protein